MFDVEVLPDYEYETLQSFGVFQTDILVVATGSEERNTGIALFAKEQKVARIIASADSPDAESRLKDNGIDTFSILLSTKNAAARAYRGAWRYETPDEPGCVAVSDQYEQ